MGQCDGDRLHPCRPSAHKHLSRRLLVEFSQSPSRTVDASLDLFDCSVERCWLADLEVEDARASLRADGEQIGETSIDNEQGSSALALQKRVGRDGGAHLDCRDGSRGDRRPRRQAKGETNSGDSRVGVLLRVVAKEFEGRQAPVRSAGHDVRESPTPIDPELPTGAPHVSCHSESVT
jgi:hypothetical protein